MKLSDNAPRIGDWVLAVGNPFGLGGTVTAGIVSARGRDIGAGPYDDFIQIDAPVNKGNSGGPSFDVDGNVIGVNTAIFSPSGGSVGIAFDIPADTVKNVVAQLRDKGSVTRGWIGVQIQPVTSEIADSLGLKKAAGALVSEPQANSPAAKAGIESGDVITSVDGRAVRDARDLARRIGTMAPGTSVKLGVMHHGQEKTVTVTLGTLPNEKAAANQEKEHEVPITTCRSSGSRSRPATRCPVPKAAASSSPPSIRVASPPITASRSATSSSMSAASRSRTRRMSASRLADARKEGKHALLFRVKSGEGTRFVALPLGNA